MIEVNSVLFMGLWELVLLLIAVDVVLMVRFVRKRRREKASIERLVTLVRQGAERRKKETRELLEKKYGYSGENLEKSTRKIIREEKRFYQMLANLFTTRDTVAIENLNIAFEEAVEPYRTLEPHRIAEESEADGEEKDDSAEIKRLNKLNQELSDELKVTMNTISKMLHEYSTIFSEMGADKNDQGTVAELIVNDPALENVAQESAKNDRVAEATEMAAAGEEADGAEDIAAEESAADENLDSASLVGMFQEDDEISTQESTAEDEAAVSLTDADASSVSVMDKEHEPASESAVENRKQAEEAPDQEIDEALAHFDTDADLDEDDLTAEAAIDPAEELLAQAIDETLESHETPLPEFQEDDAGEEAAVDPIDELLAQAASEAAESHEEQAEKQLADEITETLNAPSDNLSDEDIDSLLQAATEERPEKQN